MLPSQVNKRIGQAMHDYSMLSNGDHVLVAVSGGIDSLVLIWLLHFWQHKAPISYDLHAVHIDMGIWNSEMTEPNPVEALEIQMQKIGLPLTVEKSLSLTEDIRTCHSCSKLRRKQLFDLASQLKCNKIAFGHHKDDLLETLFLNMFFSGNISTMVPKQELFGGSLCLIRPLAYLEKIEVENMAQNAGLTAVSNLCPLAGDTRREQVQKMLQNIYDQIPGAKASLFASMKNVRKGYML
ncbi:MAG TPA: tRNA 2-thiocytidine biosynthesis protein TtcA [Desulfobacterales bacterium]|nr:tRNA 2-thiocytidine biosynthesis protein TtcA [Desulfobacterales bacterium]HIP39115.1 tRNA 2-thiocytidine biosynthesis protein TtcA [Desulfocapsa sulfexigens]